MIYYLKYVLKILPLTRHITAKVAGKSVSISEASIRSDLLFDDADGIDTLPNQDIFDAIQQMGYEGDLTVLTFNKALFSPQWRFLFHTINHCLSSKSTSWDQIPTNIATVVMTIQGVYDLCLSLCQQVSDQAKEIQALKAQITKLKNKAKHVIKHHKAYLKSVSLKQRFPRKIFSKKHRMHKESVSKQGRKFAKGESLVQRDPLFDVMPEDTIDHMETKNAQSEGR
ncbi:hypothetical protein Tco_0129772, partial [Tanacetum coccineum]